jgi:hypothetical protein
MSTNYARFDKINYDTESDDDTPNIPKKLSTVRNEVKSTPIVNKNEITASSVDDNEHDNSAVLPPNLDQLNNIVMPTKMTPKSKDGRLKFEYKGRTIYEWEQSLEEVIIYLSPPAGLPRKLLDIAITHTHVRIGVLGATTGPFIDEDTGGPVKVAESTWTYSDGELCITLCKMNKAEVWDCALAGRSDDNESTKAASIIDPVTREAERKKMMLARFQEEHPGFDFSGADFNGAVPDARTFMDGVKR